MTDELDLAGGRWRRANRYFRAALELPVDDRADFVERVCRADPGICRRLRELLREAEGEPRLDGPDQSLLRAALIDLLSSAGPDRSS